MIDQTRGGPGSRDQGREPGYPVIKKHPLFFFIHDGVRRFVVDEVQSGFWTRDGAQDSGIIIEVVLRS
jgi:hypothetical protein